MRSREIPLLVILFFVCLAACLTYNLADYDIWARMAVGKLTMDLGHVSMRDIFAYTPTKPVWVDHEWGSGVLFFLVADAFGQEGLLVLRALCYFGTLVLIHFAVKERVSRPHSFLFHLFLAKALLFGFFVTVRSQVFTYLFFSLWLFLLERTRRGKTGGLAILPGTMVIWANLHGGFLSGLGLLVLYGTGEFFNRRPWRKYFVLLVLCSLLTLVNPYGLSFWKFLHEAILLPRTAIPEWRATNILGPLREMVEFKAMLLLVLAFVAVHFVRRRKIDWVDILVLSVTGYLALRHLRHTTFFVLCSTPFLYASLREVWTSACRTAALRWWTALRSARTALVERTAAVLQGTLLGFLVLLVVFLPFRIAVLPNVLPVRAVRFIQQNRLEGNLLLPFTWGNYAIWELYPQCRVASDGRYEEVYTEETFMDIYRLVYSTSGGDEALDKYPHQIILVPHDSPILSRLSGRSDWLEVYSDEMSRIYLQPGSVRSTWTLPSCETDEDPFSPKGLGRYLVTRKSAQ